MVLLRPNLALYAPRDFFTVALIGGGWLLTDDFLWEICKAAGDSSSPRERMDELARDVLGRCGGLRGRLPAFPQGVLISYHLPFVIDPLHLILSDGKEGMIFAAFSDLQPN